MTSDDEDWEEVAYLPPLWDADKNVSQEDWGKLFNESSQSDF